MQDFGFPVPGQPRPPPVPSSTYFCYQLIRIDSELVAIIDKLVPFVAKNGQQFEEEVKAKEKNNPKFSFLRGGEGHEYYLWKLNSLRPQPMPTQSNFWK
jgi:hypothetical protein